MINFICFGFLVGLICLCLSENNMKANTYIGHTMTMLSCHLTYHLSDINALKHHLMTKHNKDTDKLNSSDMIKFLINNTKIIHKNNNKNHLQILKAISIKNKKPTMNKIAFNAGINISNN